MRGAPDSEVRQYFLSRDPTQYHYTNQGSTETLTEKSDYAQTSKALRDLGFTNDELSTVWKITASILHLGNIKFICNYS